MRGVAASLARSHSLCATRYWLPLPRGEGWDEGSCSQFGLIAQPVSLPGTGSLSRGERAGMRGVAASLALSHSLVLPGTGSLSRGRGLG